MNRQTDRPDDDGRPTPSSDRDDDDAYGDPSTVKDEGVLDSLGEAVSETVRDAAEDLLLPDEPARKTR